MTWSDSEQPEKLLWSSIDTHPRFESDTPWRAGPERIVPGDIIKIPETGLVGMAIATYTELASRTAYAITKNSDLAYPLHAVELIRPVTRPSRDTELYLGDKVRVTDTDHSHIGDAGGIVQVTGHPPTYTIVSQMVVSLLKARIPGDAKDSPVTAEDCLDNLFFQASRAQVDPHDSPEEYQ